MESFIFIAKGPGKKLEHTKSWLYYALDRDDSLK